MGKWAKSLETRINSGFFVAIFIFKSGQKVGKWPEKAKKCSQKLMKNRADLANGQPKVGRSPFFRTKSGQEITRFHCSIFQDQCRFL